MGLLLCLKMLSDFLWDPVSPQDHDGPAYEFL